MLPESDFPTLSAGDTSVRFTLKAGQLKDLIERTQFAISTEETRYYLNGIYLHVVAAGDRKVLRAVATDGHRLAQAQIEAPEGVGSLAGVIVPRKTVGFTLAWLSWRTARPFVPALRISVLRGKRENRRVSDCSQQAAAP